MRETTVLVAGGAGFIGQNLCESLLEDGMKVVCIDDFSSSNQESAMELVRHEGFFFKRADVKDMNWTSPTPDKIFHLASLASPGHYIDDPVHTALTNSLGTKNLLDLASVSNARLLYASTSEIYGEPEVHPQPETYNGNVDPRGPRSCYVEAKRFGETLTVSYNRQYDIDARTVRIFNTYGPGMRIDDERVIPTFIRQALTGEDLTVYGTGEQTRSFCFIDDTIRGLREVMNGVVLQGEVFNIGRPKEITIISLAEMIVDLCDSDSNIVFEPLPQDDPTRRKPDIQKAKDRLSWEPEVDLVEGLNKTIEYFRLEMQEV